MENKIKQFDEGAKQILGADYMGFVGNQWQATGQVAVVTAEPDRGETVPAAYLDEITSLARRVFGRWTVCMPYPVEGRLIYVVAGLNRM